MHKKLPILLGRVPLNANRFHFVCVSCYQVVGNAGVLLEKNFEVLVPTRGVGGFCGGFLCLLMSVPEPRRGEVVTT